MFEIIPNWHPVFVHFTVALIVIGGMLQILQWMLSPKIDMSTVIEVQKWLVGITVAIVIATVATGLQAYYSVNHDAPSHLAMTNHRNWALFTASIFLLSAVIFYLWPKQREMLAGLGFVIAFGLVSVTAYKGSHLVYRHGLGVMSMPMVTGEGHDHEHAMGQEHGDVLTPESLPTGTSPDDSVDGHAHDESNGDSHGDASMAAPMETSPTHADSGHAHATDKPEVLLEAEVPHGHDNSDGHHDKKDPMMFSGQDTVAAKTVQAFHAAISNADEIRARSLLDNAVLIFEGGGVERSADQYASHHMKSDLAFMANMKITVLEQQVNQKGELAIAVSRTQLQGQHKGKDIDMTSMETMALEKKNGQWKIVHIHWSN